jgi:hypothetical protein
VTRKRAGGPFQNRVVIGWLLGAVSMITAAEGGLGGYLAMLVLSGFVVLREIKHWQTGDEMLADMTARKDAAYEERNKVVAALSRVFPSGIARTAIEGWSDDWHGCVYIDLPTGQVSWHFHDSQAHLFAGLPAYTKPWDGHDTPEKYRRLAAVRMRPVPLPQLGVFGGTTGGSDYVLIVGGGADATAAQPNGPEVAAGA